MKVRLFGNGKCENCKIMQLALIKERIPFLFVDSDDEERHGFLMDCFNVDRIPHVQILNAQNQVIFEHVGFIPIEDLKKSGE
jgi:hypothetical protein